MALLRGGVTGNGGRVVRAGAVRPSHPRLLLDLKEFGYYATAAALASAIPRLVQPVAIAVYPRYSQLVAAHDEVGLRAL